MEGVLPRDLRAALASGRWSSSDEDEADGEAGGDGDGGLPPVLQLRGPANRRRGAGGGGLHVSGEDGARHDGPTPPMSPGMMQALMSSGGEGEAVGDVLYGEELLGEVDEGEEGDGEAGVGGGYSSGSRRAAAAAVKRLERLERKYGRLRGRFDEVMRALQVVYATGGGNGDGAGGGGGGGGGVGLPPPEALAQLSPAVRLRLVAELLATLHRECEESVWPHLDEAALAALAGRGVAQQQQQPSVGIARRRVGSRPASASVVASGGRPMSASRAFGDGAGGAGEPGAAAGAEPPETEDGSVPTSVASQHGSKAEAEQLELEQQQQQQQQAAAEVGALPEVLQQVVGRLHAHAGQVGQTMAMAALGAAALAQALEDLEASWAEQQQRGGPSPGRRSRSVASLWLGGGVLGEGAPGRWDTGLVSPLSPGAVGPAGNGPQQGGRMTGSRLSTGSGMGDGSYLGGAAAGAAVMLLRRPSSASRGPGGLGMPMGGSRRPTSAGTGGPASHRSTSAMGEPGDQLQQQYVEQDGDQLGGDDPGVGLAVPRDSDPRDTVKLDALRALHVAAEVQAAGGDARALYDAVQHVVRLMGGQPKLTATGRIIEFFPRRLPKGAQIAGTVCPLSCPLVLICCNSHRTVFPPNCAMHGTASQSMLCQQCATTPRYLFTRPSNLRVPIARIPRPAPPPTLQTGATRCCAPPSCGSTSSSRGCCCSSRSAPCCCRRLRPTSCSARRPWTRPRTTWQPRPPACTAHRPPWGCSWHLSQPAWPTGRSWQLPWKSSR